MPIFEFTCKKCKGEFEELVFGDDISDVVCPKCESTAVERKMSVFAFKSGGKFTSSKGGSCSGCTPGPGGCSSCNH